MTLGEMMTEVYRQLGEPTTKNPFAADGETIDMGTPGAVTLRRWINRGYRRILNWRFPSGRIVRFRSTEREAFFSGVSVSGTATGAAAQSVTLDGSAAAEADRYDQWVIELTGGTGAGQKRIVVAYSAARVATVHRSWDTVPDATTTYRMTKNFYDFLADSHDWVDDNIPLSSVGEITAVLQVIDMESEGKLTRADRVEGFTSVADNAGNAPSIFSDKGGGLVFDTPVPAGRYYRLKYFGMPPELENESDQPKMPEQFHEAVLLWAVWWGLRELQEFAGAYSTKRDLEDTMATALEQFDRGGERDDISLYMEGNYGLS